MYQAADMVHCLWMPLSIVQGGQVVICYAHAHRDDPTFTLHLFFHRMGACVCVCPLLCCTGGVRLFFPDGAHCKVSVLHTSCNGWSKPAHTAVPGSACDKLMCPSQGPCTGTLVHSCEKLLKYSVFSKASPKSSPGVWVLPLHSCTPPSWVPCINLSTSESQIM